MSYEKPSSRNRSRLSTRVRTGVAVVAACFVASPVFSNPLNPTVVNGTATFNQAGSVLTVTNSNGAIINWDKFSIQAGETTHFAQAAASSTVLNRVLNDPTVIYGTLSSNGQVWLVNPAGIMVGPGGLIDTAGFVASTLAIRNEDFLAGRRLFANDGSAQNVINQGEIRTPSGGSVYLIGSNVANDGIITTPQGETLLAAGVTVSLIDSATPGVKVDITGAAGNATNLGTITAEAGRIGIAGVIVRNSGTLNASSVVSEGGRIFLKASQDAYVDGNGRIVTTGTRGGSIEVLGNRVAVMDNAVIDASGTTGGGRILVGGDYQGKNPEIQNSQFTYFGPDATLKADATEVGDGGTVIVWADDTTRAYGSISARGGALGGDGGLVETSGHRSLSIAGARVDTRAPNGQTGTWLLDPSDINIISGVYGGGWFGGLFDPGTSTTITDGDINNSLGYSSLIIQTSGGTGGSGNITATGVSINSATASGLTLAAYGGEGVTNGNITVTGSTINVNGSVTMLAGWDGIGFASTDVISGTGNINISSSTITSSAGAINLHAGNDITLGHTTTSGAGTWIQSSGQMSVSAKNLSLFGGSTGLFNISGSQQPGVMLRGGTEQVIAVENQILLQAGSANHTEYAGSPFYGGSVSIESGGTQDISANSIKVYAGLTGHDNGAQIQAYGSQAITITGSGGLLDVKGGGDGNALVYGGAGSFNNAARIQHGQWEPNNAYNGFGDQTVTIYGGGTVNIRAGSGTGALGYYGSECYASGAGELCRGSSNFAEIDNGVGFQILDFAASGSLTVTGGSAGSGNWAGIQSSGTSATTQSIYGNPNITLNGGSGGGRAVSYGGETFELSNDAGIYSDGSGFQDITAGTLTINGGNATYGGAGISSESLIPQALYVSTLGNLSMYGGTSNAAHPYGAPVYIHSEAGGDISLSVGGNLYIQSGSGTSAPAIIGSLDALQTQYVSIYAGQVAGAGNVAINASGSNVAIGAQSATYGANVYISATGSINISGSSSSGVMIGSVSDSGGTSVTLNARNDISIGGATAYGPLIGVASPTDAFNSIHIDAGWDGYGGNVLFGTSSRIDAGLGSVVVRAAQTTSANGNITQYAGSGIYGGYISIAGEGSVDLFGLASASNYLTVKAGTIDGGEGGYSSLYGGNLTLGSSSVVSGAYGVELIAQSGELSGTGGNIIQNTGGEILGGGGVDIMASGNVTLNGSVIAGGSSDFASIYIMAGAPGGYFGAPSPYGGNVSISGSIDTSAAYGSVNILANAGYATGANGNIAQNAGSSIHGSQGVSIEGGGSVTVNGSVTTGGGTGIHIEAGMPSAGYYSAPSPYGGNVVIGGNINAGGYGVSIRANEGYATAVNGDITQTGGSILGGSVSLDSAGSATLGGTVTASTATVSVQAGYQPVSGEVTPDGGNISISGTVSGMLGVSLLAKSGYSSSLNGNIVQSAGSITATSGPVAISASGDAVIGTINAPAGYVQIVTGGAIYDNNGSALNITADSIYLGSQYGGVAGGLAISMDTAAVSSLSGYVGYSAGSGGISIRNVGAQPGSISINDFAFSSAINFFNSGDLTLDGNQAFNTSANGSTQIASGGILNVAAGISGYDVSLGGSIVDVNAGVTADNNVQLLGGTVNINSGGSIDAGNIAQVVSGGILNVAAGISGYDVNLGGLIVDVNAGVAADNNVQVLGGTININSGGSIEAGNNVALAAPLFGGSINLYGGSVTASSPTAAPSYITASNGVSLPYTGIAFVAGNLYADYGGSLYAPDTSFGNISGLVTGSITLDNGASFRAGKDVDLVLAGSASMLNLLNGGYILASPTTIRLDFPARFSGGLNISGGGGLFVGSFGNWAIPGAGLVLTYAPIVNNTVTTDIVTAIGNAPLDKPPIEPPPPVPPESQLDPNKTTGGTEDTFGAEDEVKDETRNEKPAQKKYSQCT